jgi:hypothetical protein
MEGTRDRRGHEAGRWLGIFWRDRRKTVELNVMKRFSVICLQCGLNVDRLIDAETAQTEIHPVTYQQKCKIAPNAADFDCPELERAVERSRRWDPIFQSGMSRPTSSDDAIVFPDERT